MLLAIACTFVGAALGAEAVQYIDATLLTSLIPVTARNFTLFLIGADHQNAHRACAFIRNRVCFHGGFGYRFYDGFWPRYRLNFTVCFVALGHFSLVEPTARTQVLNFTSNIAALAFFLIAGLPIWAIGLTMAAGGFIGARMGAKW